MHFDISLDSFKPENNFLQIPFEQGRVLVDASFNEQTSILLYRLHRLASDLFGDSWGPFVDAGFEIQKADQTYTIGKGRYYVAGRLVENHSPISYFAQDDFPLDKDKSKLPDAPFVFYLDVWEREINDIILPDFKDPALASLSTASRSQLVWQVRAVSLKDLDLESEIGKLSSKDNNERLTAISKLGMALTKLKKLTGINNTLAARPIAPSDDSAEASTDGQYRGLENQLYRVEIHRGGSAFVSSKQPTLDQLKSFATFKWSRDNGSTVFPITAWKVNETKVTVDLSRAGLDDRSSLHVGEWVEFIDDHTVLNNEGFQVPALFQVTSIDPYEPTRITLKGTAESVEKAAVSMSFNPARPNHPFLRRWDQQPANPKEEDHIYDSDNQEPTLADDRALLVVAGKVPGGDGAAGNSIWLNLEDGVQISFGDSTSTYQRGDYWLIPARQATGLVFWPKMMVNDKVMPKPLLPHTTSHDFAPLAMASEAGSLIPCRRVVAGDLLRTTDQRSNAPATLSESWNQQASLLPPVAQRAWLVDRVKQLLTKDEFDKLKVPGSSDSDYVAKLEALDLNFGNLGADSLIAANDVKEVPIVRGLPLKKIAILQAEQELKALLTKDNKFTPPNPDDVVKEMFSAVGKLYFVARKFAEVPRVPQN